MLSLVAAKRSGLILCVFLAVVGAAAAADEWGEPPVRSAARDPRVPEFDERAILAAGKTLRYGVPKGWRAVAKPLSEGGGTVVTLAPFNRAGGDEAAFELVAARAIPPEPLPVASETAIQALAQAARAARFEPEVEKEGRPRFRALSLGGYEGISIRASRAGGGGGPAARAVFFLAYAGPLRLVMAGVAPEPRFSDLEIAFYLAAEQVFVAEAPPPRRVRPVVLDPPRRPAKPLEGFYVAEWHESHYDARANRVELIAHEEGWAFSPEGYAIVAESALPDFEGFDWVREAALDPMLVAVYDCKGETLEIRDAAGEKRSETIWFSDDAMGIGARPNFVRIDRDYANFDLSGSWTWSDVSISANPVTGETSSIRSTRTLLLHKDGTYESTGGGTYAHRDAPLARATDVESGRYRLGRGAIEFTRSDGATSRHRLRVVSAGRIEIDGRTYIGAGR
jgi:hypothetical protein